MTVEVLHGDCVCCLAEADDLMPKAGVAIVILNIILSGDGTAEDIRSDLCFQHRRKQDEALKKTMEERG